MKYLRNELSYYLQFELTKVMRIEHTDYTNRCFGKTVDFTLETIEDLIKQGENATLNLFISERKD